jgi:hypothetical protein
MTSQGSTERISCSVDLATAYTLLAQILRLLIRGIVLPRELPPTRRRQSFRTPNSGCSNFDDLFEAEVHDVTGTARSKVFKIRGKKVGTVARMMQSDLRLLEPSRAENMFGRQSADDILGPNNKYNRTSS